MRPTRVTLPPFPALARVADYLPTRGADALRAAARGAERALRTGATFRQAAWMGRSCFLRVSGAQYLSIKGIGPTPGSEMVRRALDERLRTASGGRWRCVRVSDGASHPILAQLRWRGDHWQVIDPRPEGLSALVALCREAEACRVYAAAGVRAPVAVALLVRPVDMAWVSDDRRGMRRHLAAWLAQHTPHVGGARAPTFRGLRHDTAAGGGVLIRAVRSPYRLANLQHAAAAGDAPLLRHLAAHALRVLGLGPPSDASLHALGATITSELARAAARMLAGAIVHGQLGMHHQNVSLAGELVDLDASVFLGAYARRLGAPLGPTPSRDVDTVYRRRIRRAESRLGVRIGDDIARDLRRHRARCRDAHVALAESLLRPSFELYAHALRVVDLLRRAACGGLSRSGTILAADEIASVRRRFASVVAGELAARGALALLPWVLDRGASPLRASLGGLAGRRSVHGWWTRGVPVDHLRMRCDAARVRAVVAEYDALTTALRG